MDTQEIKAQEDIKAQLDRIEGYARLAAKEVYTTEEAMLYTGLCRQTLYRLTCSRSIPHYKVGGTLRFKRSELDEWMTHDRVATQKELDRKAATYTTLKNLGYTKK